ncbi:head-tail adaptor protein [Xanthobacter agilis]|uniref:Head-tail adaptor n=1 Tax=Xanthobacter agilis TaxID=47492 RepID=A0ABU0LHF4_XANAG|nr:head-tail adaptor protein [Xanthobacter agilis]MDQ0506549.1 head-tail adaptor [Xanthobacter agilis]
MSAIAALRQRLTHQTCVDLADGAGGTSHAFLSVEQMWGAVETVATEFGVSEERPRAAHGVRITVRAPHTIAPGDRLLLGARVFQVEAVTDADGRGRFSRCHCREEQP